MLMNEKNLQSVVRLIVSNMSSFIKFGGLYVLFPSNEIWTSVMFLVWSSKEIKKKMIHGMWLRSFEKNITYLKWYNDEALFHLFFNNYTNNVLGW